MNFFKWLGQSNSVVLEFDHINDSELETFEGQIEEVEKYYQFSKLEEIGLRVKLGKRQGFAAILFKNPRKSVLLRIVPFLVGKKIPFTIFLRTDCVGLNKLPHDEELNFYSQKYPEKLTQEVLEQKKKILWNSPDEIETFLRSLRKEMGPLPLELIDPTFFFSTWGKLIELPKELVEWGITLYVSSNQRSVVENEILFMRQQLGVLPRVARVAQFTQDAVWNETSLSQLNIAACVTGSYGAVTRESQWWDLSVWRFST